MTRDYNQVNTLPSPNDPSMSASRSKATKASKAARSKNLTTPTTIPISISSTFNNAVESNQPINSIDNTQDSKASQASHTNTRTTNRSTSKRVTIQTPPSTFRVSSATPIAHPTRRLSSAGSYDTPSSNTLYLQNPSLGSRDISLSSSNSNFVKNSTSNLNLTTNSNTNTNTNAPSRLTIANIDIQFSQGKRQYMEDVVYCSEQSLINNRFFVAFVFDGHSGSEAAKFLSESMKKLLPMILLDNINTMEIPAIMTKTIDEIGDHFKRKKAKLIDGCTISGVIVDTTSNYIHVINLGDSQTILYGNQGKVQYVTKRDTTEDIEERKRLASFGVTCIKDASGNGPYRMYGLNMTKAFGNYHTKELDTALVRTNGRQLAVQSIMMPKTQQNMNILIATDGLFDEISALHITEVPLLRRLKVAQLLDLVKDHGYKGDNVSAIKINIKKQ